MTKKLLPCEYPDCDQMLQIRSKIKNKGSEYYGLHVCNKHANQERGPRTKSEKTLRTEKSRKEQRKDYPEFYQSQIEKATGKPCLECQKILTNPDSTNIVHVLAKSTSPEVATNPQNIIYLCSAHHTMFDRSLEKRSQMECFDQALERYQILKPFLKNITAETRHFETKINKK